MGKIVTHKTSKRDREFVLPNGYKFPEDDHRQFAAFLRFGLYNYGPGLESDTSFVYDVEGTLKFVIYGNTAFKVEKI